ncbi:MAG: hypothetical protein D6722_20840 [Bacteroidetes bacterium]|nr:MAG: hypothetical protein D6722_20840 [Bacteroidota bacterium]
MPKHLILLTVLVSISFSTGLWAQGPGKRAYMAAENFRKQNKCQDAIMQYDEAIKAEPTNYRYYFQRGKCEYKLNRIEEAINSFQFTIDYQADFTPAYSLLAKIYKDQKDYANAVYNYEQAARYERNSGRKVQYLLLLVNLLLKEERVADARRHIERARDLDPTNPNILFYTAEIATLSEDWEGARRAYEKALTSDRLKEASPTEQAKYYYGLGVALSKLGDSAGARRAWSKANFGPYKDLIAQQVMQASHVHYYKVAVSYYLNGEYEEANAFVDEALALQRNFSSGYILKGKIAYKSGNARQALTHYQRAMEMEANPQKKAKILRMMAQMQLADDNYADALSTLAQITEVIPQAANSSDLLSLKARAEYGARRYAEATTTLQALMNTGLDTKARAKYSFMLGMAARRTGDMELAREAFQNAMYGPYKPAAKAELDKLPSRG